MAPAFEFERLHVQGGHRVDVRVLEHTGLEHRVAAAVLHRSNPFLIGLEEQLHATLQLRLMILQDLRRAKQHSGVRVMAARMHVVIR